MRVTTSRLPISPSSSTLTRCLSLPSIRTPAAPVVFRQPTPSRPAQRRHKSSKAMPVPNFSTYSVDTIPGIMNQLTALVDPPQGGGWTLLSNGNGVERTFRFKTFKAAWNFMNAVAEVCKKEKHHPEWTNVYNSVHVRWTTHVPPSLSGQDLLMARLCDELAAEHGEIKAEKEKVEPVEEQKQEEGLQKLTDHGVDKIGGDCCKPKKP